MLATVLAILALGIPCSIKHLHNSLQPLAVPPTLLNVMVVVVSRPLKVKHSHLASLTMVSHQTYEY